MKPAKAKLLLRCTAILLGLLILVSVDYYQNFSGIHLLIESSWAQVAPTTPVGTTAGDFQVNGNGGAVYTIPIEVPPGRNGIQPQLSLQYNSQQTNGLLGVGWSLAGIPTIARCPKTFAQDGEKGGIGFNSNDRFCMDGQRLVSVSGVYGADGTEYRTERESWMKIVSHGSAGSGPAYFTAVAEDGSQIEFGNIADSRIEATGRSEVRVWSVNKVTDRNGNYLTVAYTDDSADGAYYPATIQYTGNSNGYAPQRRVEFVYEGRTDVSAAYVAGSMVNNTKRLKTVQTKVGATLVKEYRLAYEYSQATGRSRMTSVQECGGDNVCLPATTFGWAAGNQFDFLIDGTGSNEGLPAIGFFPADVNGDGLSDIVQAWDHSGHLALISYLSRGDGTLSPGIHTDTDGGTPNHNNVNIFPADVNGDGLSDIVQAWYHSGHPALISYLSRGDGTFSPGIHTDTDEDVRHSFNIFPADVDGDGLSDIVQARYHSGHPALISYLSRGDGTFSQEIHTPDMGAYAPSLQFFPADVNGDGLSDIVQTWDNEKRVSFISFLSRGDGTFSPGINTDADAGVSEIDVFPADVNGDGLSDIVIVQTWDNEKRVSFISFLSQGDGTFSPGIHTDTNADAHHAIGFFPADVNGDGLPDIIQASDEDNPGGPLGIVVYPSQGDGTFSQWRHSGAPRSSRPAIGFFPADINGDGLADFVQVLDNGAYLDFLAFISLDPPERGSLLDLLIAITNGLGSQIQVEYKPLTDASVYTKGSGAEFPVVDVQAPMYVVSRHVIKESASSPTSFIYDHQYETARTNLHRGWQGFEKTILIDSQNATRTVTTYYLDFPLTGMIQSRVITEQTDKTKILGKTNWDYRSTQDASKVYRIWLDNSKTDHYTEGTFNYTLGVAYVYDDDYRNITQVWHQGDQSGTQEEDDFYTCTQYHGGTGDDWWQASFPQATKRVKTAAACNNWKSWDASSDLTWQQYGYDSRMNLTAERAWDDSKGKFVETSTGYDAYGNVTSVTDALGNRSSISYDHIYHTFPFIRTTPATTNVPDGLTVATTFEPEFGIKTQIVDANGNVSMQIPGDGIDSMGRVVEVKGPNPQGYLVTIATLQFSAGANGVGMVSTSRYRTAWTGDNTPDSTWLVSEEYIDGLGRITKITSNGYADGVALISGAVEFNSQGQVEKSYLPYYLRASDNCVQSIPNGPCVDKPFSTHEYDTHGRPTRTTAPNGAVEEVDYNLHDDRQVITKNPDPTLLSGTGLVEWTEHFTSRGRVKERIAPDGKAEHYDYDVLGRVISTTGPLGQVRHEVYNSLGQVISETQVEQGTTAYRYNDNGNLAQRIDAKNQKITFTYDALGRVTSKQVYNSQGDTTPVKTVTYTYDESSKDNGKGRLTKIDSPESTQEFSYDTTGAVKEKRVLLDIDGDGTKGTSGNQQETVISRFTYDAAGRIDEITYPDGSKVRHNYRSTDGTLQSIERQEPGQSWKTYAGYEPLSALGAQTQVRYGNDPHAGTLSTYTYDTVGRLTGSVTSGVAPNSSPILNFSYSWNLANKLLEIIDNTKKGLGQTFKNDTHSAYDNRGRLLKAQGFYGTKDYAYDATGNLTRQGSSWYVNSTSKKNQLQAVCSGAPAGQACQSGQELGTVSYDANGNLSQSVSASKSDTTAYIYDAEDRLTELQRNNTTVNRFTYDFAGNRISKTDYDASGNETLTSFYPFGLYEIVKKADGSSIHTAYLQGPQGVIAAISKNQTSSLNNWLAYNTGTLRASMADPWGSPDGLGQYLSGKLTQFYFYPFAGEALKAGLGLGYLALVFTGVPYLLVRSTARIRRRVLRGLRTSGAIQKQTFERWQGSRDADGETGLGRLWTAFAVLLVFIGSTALAPPSVFAALTPGSNGPGIPEAGKVLFFHHDHIGSDILVTDENGDEMSQVAYEPYGQMDQKKSTGTDNFRPKFTGKEWDAGSALYYFGARYHDPQLGRFLTPDPAGQFHSPYMYGSGDPLSEVDPDGRFFITLTVILVGILIGAYVGGAAVNHSLNPASWDWSSGKTWAGIAGGAAIGGAAAGAGLAAAAGIAAGVAAAGLSGAAATAATVGGTALAMGAIAGTANVAFSAMGGDTGADLGKAFGMGFALGFVMAIPVVGDMALVGMGGYDTYQFIKDTSVGNGIALGIDILSLGMAAGARFGRNGEVGEEAEARGCASFTENTEVATGEGKKAIEDMEVGDEVWSYDEKTEKTVLNPVSKRLTRIAAGVIAITIGTATVEATLEHPFYVSGEGWVQAKDLEIGDKALQRDGNSATVTALQVRDGDVRVYNFEVANTHTYFVSDEEVLVHNPNCTITKVSDTGVGTKRQGERIWLAFPLTPTLSHQGRGSKTLCRGRLAVPRSPSPCAGEG